MTRRKTANVPEKEGDAAFTKAQLLESKRYCDRRDMINALLADDEHYTIERADAMVDKFMKGKVK